MENNNNVRVIQSQQDLVEVRADWRDLWTTHCSDNVFSSYEWIESYISAFDLEQDMFVLVWTVEGKVAALLPLYWSNEKVLRVIGDSRSDYCDMVCRPDDAREAWGAFMSFLQSRDDWIAVDIRQTPDFGRIITAWQEDAAGEFDVSREPMAECPSIDLTGDAAEYRKMLNKKSMRRVFNKLARRGELSFEVLTEWNEIEPFLPTFFSQHVSRWNSIGQASIYEKGAQRDFARRYTMGLSATDSIHLSILRCGDEIAATHLGFLSGGRFVWYKPTYSLEFSDLSPGKVMLRFLLDDVMARGATCFDFTRGVESYKLSLSNQVTQNYGLLIWPGVAAKFRYYAIHVPKRKLRSATGRYPVLRLGNGD